MSAFADELAPHNLVPLWERLAALVTPEPHRLSSPCVWRWAETRAALMRAGELVTAEEAERRVLILEDPALKGQSAITPWLYAGLQLVLPGERAPSHRHTQSALRFVLEGSGGFTTVEGEPLPMERGDLILTPNWTWHEHIGGADGPTIWLDGLDIPAVRLLGASFAERLGAAPPLPARPPGLGEALRRSGGVPVGGAVPVRRYAYADARAALAGLAEAAPPDPFRGWRLDYRGADGGPVLPTIGCSLTLLPAGFRTQPLRSTDAAVCVVVEGKAELSIDGRPQPLRRGDIASVPSWAAARWTAGSNDAIVFRFSAEPVLRMLGLLRECSAAESA